jgi:peptidoglycan hydrolase CwlO-like protein
MENTTKTTLGAIVTVIAFITAVINNIGCSNKDKVIQTLEKQNIARQDSISGLFRNIRTLTTLLEQKDGQIEALNNRLEQAEEGFEEIEEPLQKIEEDVSEIRKVLEYYRKKIAPKDNNSKPSVPDRSS